MALAVKPKCVQLECVNLNNIESLLKMTTSCRLLQGIMLVYDITNEKSFDNIRNWIRNIEEVQAPLTPSHHMTTHAGSDECPCSSDVTAHQC